MLSAFSYGYAGMMPFGGFLASRFGGAQGAVYWGPDRLSLHDPQPCSRTTQPLPTRHRRGVQRSGNGW